MKNYLIIIGFSLLSCSGTSKSNSTEDSFKTNTNKELTRDLESASFLESDTAIHKMPAITAKLKNGKEYYEKNNKYINWDTKDKRIVVIKCVVEKDSTTSNIVVARSSGKKNLDEESIRLIKNAKIVPGKNDGGRIVRSQWTTVIDFPGVL